MGSGREGDAARGLVAGVAAGLAGAWVMNRFQAWWAAGAAGSERDHGAQSVKQGPPRHGVGRRLEQRGREEAADDATERAAKAVAEPLLGRSLTEGEQQVAGTVAHYAMGAGSGAIYGVAAERLPWVTAGAGLPFGASVWLVADEGIVPALGLAKAPTRYPASTHVYAAASHLVYGLATEIVRRAVRRTL